MGVRGGDSYVRGLRAHPKNVWIAGRKVGDVTQDPAFHRPVAAMAMLYDCQLDDELRPKMAYRPDDGDDEEVGLSFIIARAHDDLVRRREAMRIWADATFGLMGRSPDYLNTLLAAFADAPDFFAQCGAECCANVQRYYRFCRNNDLFLTHAIVNPQVDRSKASSEQADAYAHLRIVEEARDGLIVRGAKMLATHGPTADEILVYPLPFSLRPGEEKYALAFGIPTRRGCASSVGSRSTSATNRNGTTRWARASRNRTRSPYSMMSWSRGSESSCTAMSSSRTRCSLAPRCSAIPDIKRRCADW
jgi:anthranilate 3-monooxygenase (FAD) / 4-hydroxyphenylacetate 3-monooxygenase